MKARVITIMDNPLSVKVAERCIRSAAKFEIDVEMHQAMTPSMEPKWYARKHRIPTEGFEEKYSRFENCLSAFISHYSLWQRCVAENTPYLILEHDAYFVDAPPILKPFNKAMNIGKPSYGKADRPMKLGVGPLVSKPYFPGAHAYMIKPAGAKAFIAKAQEHPLPTDVFINKVNFPWLEEFFPWPVEARDTFTTIQKVEGCLAKHNYNDDYKII